jgi:hypothetical protein
MKQLLIVYISIPVTGQHYTRIHMEDNDTLFEKITDRIISTMSSILKMMPFIVSVIFIMFAIDCRFGLSFGLLQRGTFINVVLVYPLNAMISTWNGLMELFYEPIARLWNRLMELFYEPIAKLWNGIVLGLLLAFAPKP